MPRKKTVETEVVWEETPDGVTLPEGWRWVKLGEVCKTTSGGTPNRKVAEYYSGEIPWVKSGELSKGLILDTEEKISKEAVCHSNAKVFPKGTLLIALYGATIGKLGFLGIDAATNQAICAIFQSKDIRHDYLYYYLLSQRDELIQKGTGGAQPNISQQIIRDTHVPLPPLPTQQKIVAKIEALFTELDAGMEKLKAAQQQLKVYRQAVLKAAFEGELTNTEYIEWQQLSDVVESVQYGSSAKSMESGDVPVIRMGNIQNGKIDWTDLVFTNDKDEISKYLLSDQDVLFNRTNSPELVGKTAIYCNEMQAIYAGYLIKINYDKSKIIGKYLNFFLNSPVAKNYSNTVKTDGVNQSNINGKKLLTYPFPFTPVHIQQSIVTAIETRLTACEAMEKEIEVQLNNAAQLRQSILKKAFSGELIKLT